MLTVKEYLNGCQLVVVAGVKERRGASKPQRCGCVSPPQPDVAHNSEPRQLRQEAVAQAATRACSSLAALNQQRL